MIPRDNLDRLYKNQHSFCGLSSHQLARIAMQRTRVPLKDTFADTLDRFAIILNNGPSFDLHPSQFIVARAGLYEAGKPVVAPQVERLLLFRIGPENDPIID